MDGFLGLDQGARYELDFEKGGASGEVTIMIVPVATLQALHIEATKRGMSIAQLLGKSLSEYLTNHPPQEG